MTTKLHVNVKSFIKDPYVISVSHIQPISAAYDITAFRKILKIAKTTVTETWGYSNPAHEVIKSEKVAAVWLGGLGSTYDVPVTALKSYWLFSDKMDALRFRLSLGDTAKQTHMWPKNKLFTITEYIEDNKNSA